MIKERLTELEGQFGLQPIIVITEKVSILQDDTTRMNCLSSSFVFKQLISMCYCFAILAYTQVKRAFLHAL